MSGPLRPGSWLAVTLVVAAMLQAGSGTKLTPLGWAIAVTMVACVLAGWTLLVCRAVRRGGDRES